MLAKRAFGMDTPASGPEASAEQAGGEHGLDLRGVQPVRGRAQGRRDGDEVLGSQMERELAESDVDRAVAALLDVAELGGDEASVGAGDGRGLAQG